MTVTIELTGIRLHARHGVLEHERREGQRFLVDVELDVDGTRVVVTDEIDDTVDYRHVAACVREVSDARAYRLLEAFAGAVADELLTRFGVARVRVRVRKPDVVLDPPVESAAVVVERG